MDFSELQLRAANDPEFRAALLADPRAVLVEAGAALPDDLGIRIVESTAEELILCIPPELPEGVEIDEDVLADTAAGITPLSTAMIWPAVISAGLIGGGGSFVAGAKVGQAVKKAFG